MPVRVLVTEFEPLVNTTEIVESSSPVTVTAPVAASVLEAPPEASLVTLRVGAVGAVVSTLRIESTDPNEKLLSVLSMSALAEALISMASIPLSPAVCRNFTKLVASSKLMPAHPPVPAVKLGASESLMVKVTNRLLSNVTACDTVEALAVRAFS